MVDLIMLLSKLLTSNHVVLCGEKHAASPDTEIGSFRVKQLALPDEVSGRRPCWAADFRCSKEPQADEDSNCQSCRTAPRGLFQAGEVQLSKTLHCFTWLVCGDLAEHSTLAESQWTTRITRGYITRGCGHRWCRKAGLPSFPTCLLYSSAALCRTQGLLSHEGQVDMLTLFCHTYMEKGREPRML